MDEFRLFNDVADSKVETFLPQSTEYCLPRRQFSKIIPHNQLNWLIIQCQTATLSKSCYLKVFDTLQAIKQCNRSQIIFGNGDFHYSISNATSATCVAGTTSALGATGQ